MKEKTFSWKLNVDEEGVPTPGALHKALREFISFLYVNSDDETWDKLVVILHRHCFKRDGTELE